ncbi:MAG: HAD family hydrolase [Aquificaceae bacterium]|nr:MAG: HAD family hydrolase [Aquificaceae bacterium]
MKFVKLYIDKLFKLASIQRWNDHPKPFSITELDKQGHKAIIAYLFAKIEEAERDKEINWRGLIEGLIFEALQRAVFTDLKPPLFHKLLETKKEQLNRFLFENYRSFLKNFSSRLWENFYKYFCDDSYLKEEKHIIRASHFIPTYWEFQFIYPIARSMFGIEKVKTELENTLEDFHNLIGIQRFLLRRKLYGFVNLCGQLRFQKRWISIERIPQTSVMGHLFTVSTVVYLLMEHLSEEIEISPRAFYSTFFTALFHDLPEIITRDIISSLKEVLGKEEIRKVEIEGLEKEVLILVPSYVANELRIFLGLTPKEKALELSEFSNRLFTPKRFKTFQETETSFLREEEGYPIWGTLVKFADLLAAYYEAFYTLKHGLRNEELENAYRGLKRSIENHPIVKLFPHLKGLIEGENPLGVKV